jgi:hypothetical protein
MLNLVATAALPAARRDPVTTNARATALSQAFAALESRAGGRLGATVVDEKGVVAN